MSRHSPPPTDPLLLPIVRPSAKCSFPGNPTTGYRRLTCVKAAPPPIGVKLAEADPATDERPRTQGRRGQGWQRAYMSGDWNGLCSRPMGAPEGPVSAAGVDLA